MTEAPNRATRLGMLNGVSAALQASHPPAAAPVPSPNAVASFWYPMTAPAAAITTPSAAPPAHGMPRECSSAPAASAPLVAVMVWRTLLPGARAVTTCCTSGLTRLRRVRAPRGVYRGTGGGGVGRGTAGPRHAEGVLQRSGCERAVGRGDGVADALAGGAGGDDLLHQRVDAAAAGAGAECRVLGNPGWRDRRRRHRLLVLRLRAAGCLLLSRHCIL